MIAARKGELSGVICALNFLDRGIEYRVVEAAFLIAR